MKKKLLARMREFFRLTQAIAGAFHLPMLVFVYLMTSMAPAQAQVVRKIDILEGQVTPRNYVRNPSARENILFTSKSASTTLTRETGTSPDVQLDGVASFGIDTANNLEYVEFNLETIRAPEKSAAKECEFTGEYYGDGTLYAAQILDGSNVVQAQSLNFTNATEWSAFGIRAPCGATRKVRITQVTAGTTPKIYVGRLAYRRWTGLFQLSQASFFGGAQQEGGANCNFTENTSTAETNWVTLGAAGSCAQAWTSYGNCVATGPTAHTITCTNMPEGDYKFEISSNIYNSIQGESCNFKYTDGTNQFGYLHIFATGTGAASGGTLNGRITYPSGATTRTFSVQASDSGMTTTCGIANSQTGKSFIWRIWRYPLQNQLALNAAQIVDSVGSVLAYAGTCPANTLLADGTAVSRTTYARLFNKIGTAHGTGNGTTTFKLPDYRGRFLRGVAGGSTLDPDRASRTAMATGGSTGDNVGSVQGHAFQTHTHTQNPHNHTIGTGASATAAGGNFTTPNYDGIGGIRDTNLTTATNNNTGATGTNSQATANETRPVNAGVNYCIVFDGSTQFPIIANGVVARDYPGVTTINTYKQITANYTLTDQDETIQANGTGGYTVSLPAAASMQGKKFIIHNFTTSPSEVTIDPFGSETICGQTTIKLTGNDDFLEIQSNGGAWRTTGCKKLVSFKTNYCVTSPCSFDRNSGSAFGALRVSTGLYSVDFISGTFGTIYGCTATVNVGGGNTNAYLCQNDVNTAWTANKIYFQCRQASNNAASDAAIDVLCHGTR